MRGKRSPAGAGRRLLLVILLVAAGLGADNATCPSAWADDLRSGIAAYDRGDYAAALKILTPLAEAGDKYAQSHLGAMYLHGMGVEKNYAEALKWTRKAAEAGLAGSQHMLGQMYWVGLGVPKNYDEAAKWYQKAAEQGSAEAQSSLAYMYQHGQSVPRDPNKAVELYRKAANHGLALAQYQMGLMSAQGEDLAKDYVQAYMWFTLALAHLPTGVFHDDATQALKALGGQMSATQVSEAKRLAKAWQPMTE